MNKSQDSQQKKIESIHNVKNQRLYFVFILWLYFMEIMGRRPKVMLLFKRGILD